MVNQYQPTSIHERKRFLEAMNRKWENKYYRRYSWTNKFTRHQELSWGK